MALALAAVALEDSNAVFDADAASLQRFIGLPILSAAALRLMRLVPLVGPVLAVSLPAIRSLATERVRQIAVQKAANDATLIIVRRAAANEARFLRTGS